MIFHHSPQSRKGIRPNPGGTPAKWPHLRVVCAVMLLSISRPLQAETIQWRSDYTAALKEAAQKGLPLLLNVGTPECYWCKQLERRTFIDDDVSQVINQRFIPLKVDGSQEQNTALVQALKVQSYPTLIFASHDGNILGYQEGFQEATTLKEQMTKVLVSVGTPDWMQRDFEGAEKALASADYAKAIGLLRNVVEDGQNRPVQVKARKTLSELEARVTAEAQKARKMIEEGKGNEALATLENLKNKYTGTVAVERNRVLMAELVSRRNSVVLERRRKAQEILKQARLDQENRQFLCALDRCEELSSQYSDLPEGEEAEKLAGEIKENPEWTRQAAEQMGDRLSLLYLSLADSLLKKGQPQQATFYLERVQKMFPGSRHAETAQLRLSRLQGAAPRK